MIYRLRLAGDLVTGETFPPKGQKPVSEGAIQFAPAAFFLTASDKKIAQRSLPPLEWPERWAVDHAVAGVKQYAPWCKVEIVEVSEKEKPMKRNNKTKPKKENGVFDVGSSMKPESAPDPSAPIERARYREKLPCAIDQLIADVAATELAGVIVERAAFLVRVKAENAKRREKRAHYDERIEELGAKINGKSEQRDVDCVEHLYPAEKKIVVIRLDTGEAISNRAAEAEDLQEVMLDGTGKPLREPQSKKKPKAGEPVASPAQVDGFLDSLGAP